MKKLLSICIPTRNRFHTLKKNIDHLSKIIVDNNFENFIDVLISDNSLINNRFNENFFYKLPFIKYFISDDLGHDINILNLINNANSDYIWLCQDHAKIIDNELKNIIDVIISKEKDYIFLSTKKNYSVHKYLLNNLNFISFKNIYLNTNLIRLNIFKKEYNLLMSEYNNSHLVFHFAIINMLFTNDKLNVEIIYNQCSIYKYFDTKGEHKKMTWSHSLNNYINILNYSSVFYNKFLLKFPKHKKIFYKIFKNKINSVPTIYRIYQLLLNSQNDKILNYEFLNHPSFNYFDRFVLRNLLFFKNNYFLKYVRYFLLLELYFFIFLPKIFLNKFFNKFFYKKL